MNHQRPFFLGVMIILIIIQADHLALGQVACLNNGNYTSNSVYSVNLNSSVSSLDNNIDSNGFYNASVGQGPDTANAMVLCRGDLQLNTCRECVRKASDTLLRSCPVQKQAVTWEESCMVRYSNETIYGTQATAPRYWLINPQNVTSPERFKADLRTLLDGLRERAASGGSLRKVAAGDTTGPDFQSIYALVQCTPDLSPQDCTNCLITAATDIPRCCDGRRGGRVIMPSCQLRFEDLSFFNKTRLDELESMPVPGPGPGPGPGPQPPSQSSPGKEGGNTNRTVIIVVVPIISILIILVVFVILLRKRRTHKLIEDSQSESVVEDISTSESLQYSFNTLKAATNNFSDDNKLGQGGFGAVYKGKLPDGKEIAVKRLSMSSGQGDLEFKNEVVLLVKLQHRNLVRLLGFALEKMEKLLVYEFVENASLDLFIFGQAHHSYLNWDRRYKIIVGIARGLLYLHEDSRLRIIHRDLKASNILLDTDMNPKIADFGMARLFGQDETQGNTSRIVGTYGYMPPEYLLHGQFSVKSDVFSFGVLILEIISGQKNNNYGSGENAQDLLSYAWNNWREGTSRNIVDPLLVTGSGASGSMRDIMRCIHIGLLCVQENVADRPTMAAVVLMLSSSSITLTLPSEPAFYFSSGYGSDVSRLQEYSSRNPEYNSSHKQADQSDHSSQNDASISEFYPR